MLFNSPTFLIFFAVVFGIYWKLPTVRLQNLMLLVASYIFYGAWSWKFLALIWLSTLIDYGCGLAIDAARSGKRRNLFLLISIVSNLSLLGFFKYAGFFVREAGELLHLLGFQAHVPTLSIILPIGISFYTFQSLSYTIDIHRGKLKATRSLADFALFVAFFPQLVAGPIERATRLLPQIQKPRHYSAPLVSAGVRLMIWGLFKKVVIADNLAPFVDAVYSDPTHFSGLMLVTASIFFAFQIYGDFSGYSDMARGIARMLGFELVLNFDFPYFSRNPVEFWRRWHISLSQWFQDYLYFPLAMRYMRRGGWASKYKAHIIAMGLIGLWHGANWTFVNFGLFWGVAIAVYLFFQEKIGAGAPDSAWRRLAETAGRGRLTAAGAVLMMYAIILVGWILFRSPSMHSAWYILTHIASSAGQTELLRPDVINTSLLWLMVLSLWTGEWVYRNTGGLPDRLMQSATGQLVVRHALIIVIVLSWSVAQELKVQPFIYFQF